MKLGSVAAIAGLIVFLATVNVAAAGSMMQAGPVFTDPGVVVDCAFNCPGTSDTTIQVKVVDGSGTAIYDSGPESCPAGSSGYAAASASGILHCEVLGLSAKKATGTLYHFHGGAPIAVIPMH